MSKEELEEGNAPTPPRFGRVYTLHPQTTHTHTIIMLHGRGSTGPDFAEDFFSSELSSHASLREKLPGIRWVFPSSQELWSSTFEETMPMWLDAYSLTDINARRELQVGGLRDSLNYLQGILDREITKLAGQASKVLLGGISLGGAISLWMLLRRGGPARDSIGGVFAASTYLPFARNFERLLALPDGEQGRLAQQNEATEEGEFDGFVKSMIPDFKQECDSRTQQKQSSRVFLSHGRDDAYVGVTLGRQARDVLLGAGFEVDWKEYSGAEEEGHWFKVPEQMDDIYQFIVECT